jgi:hypothetical protein
MPDTCTFDNPRVLSSAVIAPADAVVAARSFPRRWRALFALAAGDDDAPDVLTRSGAPGLAIEAAQALGAAASRLRPGGSAPAGEPLDVLTAEATRLAEAIDATDPARWDEASVGLVSEAVDRAATLLRQAERAVTAARGG